MQPLTTINIAKIKQYTIEKTSVNKNNDLQSSSAFASNKIVNTRLTINTISCTIINNLNGDFFCVDFRNIINVIIYIIYIPLKTIFDN